MKRFMVVRASEEYMGEFFDTQEEAEKNAKEQCEGDPGGDFHVFELLAIVTRPRRPEAVLRRLP